MLRNILSRVGTTALKAFGAVKEPIRKIGQIGYSVGKFAVQNHAALAPLIHSVAMASGNTKAQQISGGLLALSQMASTRQKLNESNAKIAEATRANGGVGGVYNHATGKFNGT